MGYVQTAGVRVHPVPGERFPPLLAEVVQLIPVCWEGENQSQLNGRSHPDSGLLGSGHLLNSGPWVPYHLHRYGLRVARHHAPVLRPSCGLGRAVIDLTQVDS